MATAGRIRIGGIMSFRDLCLIGVMSAPDRPGLASAIFQALGEAHLNTQFIVQCIDLNRNAHVLFCIAQEDCARVLKTVEPVARKIGAQRVTHYQPVALLSVFGPDFRERPGIAGAAFGALAAVGINILAVSTSISTISCVIDGHCFDQALQALYTVFELP